VSLVGGGPLIIEDLDLSQMGLYLDTQCDINDLDVFDSGYTSLGRTLYKKKSEEGVKRRVFYDTELKLHKELVKK
jgi:hypothetical protein